MNDPRTARDRQPVRWLGGEKHAVHRLDCPTADGYGTWAGGVGRPTTPVVEAQTIPPDPGKGAAPAAPRSLSLLDRSAKPPFDTRRS